MPSDTLTDRFGRELKEGSLFVLVSNRLDPGKREILQPKHGVRKMNLPEHSESCWYAHYLVKRLTHRLDDVYEAEGFMVNSSLALRKYAIVIPANIVEMDKATIIGYIKMLGIEVQEEE